MRLGMMFLFCLYLYCGSLTSNVMKMNQGDPFAESGALNLAFTSDAFSASSPEKPILIRLRLADGARLAETKVDLVGSTVGHHPIYLALIVQTVKPNVTMAAPSDTLSIVRWRQGESEIWLRVQRSSSGWLMDDGTAQGPRLFEYRVSTHLGVSASVSHSYGTVFHNRGHANLPGNTRELVEPFVPVDTIVHLDLTSTILVPGDAQLIHSIYFYGDTDVIHPQRPADIITGPQIPVPIRANEIRTGRIVSAQ